MIKTLFHPEVTFLSQLKTNRYPALDITRCFALLCVVTYHFFAYTTFYHSSVEGIRMIVLGILYYVSSLGVPLFLLLSGYLMGSKRPSKRYYCKIAHTLGIYVLASGCCYLYRYFAKAEPAVAGNFGDFLAGTLDYSVIPHAWYIAMYIGLFFIIPYLNILYDALDGKQQRRGLVLTLVCVTMLPEVTNILRVEAGQWLGFRLHTGAYQVLLPSFWCSSYPMAYYLIGRHLREYPLSWKPLTRFLAAAGGVLAVGGGNVLLCYGTSLVLGPWASYASALTMIHAVLIFQFLSRLECSRMSSKLTDFLSLLSRLCLGAYLVSWIFEDIFHKRASLLEPDGYRRMLFLPILVPAVYLCSLVLSGVLEGLYRILAKGFGTIQKRS